MNKIKIIFGTIVLIIVIICFASFQKDNKMSSKDNNKVSSDYTIEPFKLKNHILAHNDKYDMPSIDYIENGKIFGSIINFPSDAIYYTTKYIFKYDVQNDDYSEIKVNGNYTIQDYYIIEDYIYFVSLKYSEKITWELYISDLNLNNIKKIMEGTIDSDFNSPKLFFDNQNKKLYFLTITNEAYNEYCKLYELTNYDSKLLFFYEGNHDTKNGTFLQNMLYVENIDNNLYFSLVKDYNTNIIYKYDLTNQKLTEILRKETNECYFTSYYFTNIGYFINGTNSDGKIENYFYDITENKIDKLNSNMELYYGRAINEKNLLFHKSSSWYLLDINTKKISSINLGDNYYLPNYYVINTNKILVSNSTNGYYLIELKNE